MAIELTSISVYSLMQSAKVSGFWSRSEVALLALAPSPDSKCNCNCQIADHDRLFWPQVRHPHFLVLAREEVPGALGLDTLVLLWDHFQAMQKYNL